MQYIYIYISKQFLASILRSYVWLRKALEPEGRNVGCCSTSWSPSYIIDAGNQLLYMVWDTKSGAAKLYLFTFNLNYLKTNLIHAP